MPFSTGEWYTRLESLGSSSVSVQLFRSDGGAEWLEGSWKLREAGAETGRIVVTRGFEYRVVFTAFGRTGTSVLSEHFLGNRLPVACFSITPAEPLAHEMIHFDASCSRDPDGQVYGFRWDFGDGSSVPGPGVYHTYSVEGTYTATLTVYDNDFGFAQTSKEILVAPMVTQFSPPHVDYGSDSDHDGLFNVIILEAYVQIGDPGAYRISGRLTDADGLLAVDGESPPTTPSYGRSSIFLTFDGVAIRRSGVNGPYAIALQLARETLEGWTVVASGDHVTAAYSASDFELPAVAFVGPHTDYGVDADADGYFDFLDVEARVLVQVPGSFRIVATLQPPGLTVDYYPFVTTGYQTVLLRFDGLAIRRYGVSGPYRVDMTAYTFNGEFLDADGHTTSAHDPLSFDPPSARFILPIPVAPVDSDGDGLANKLRASIGIDVYEYDLFTVDARVFGPLGEGPLTGHYGGDYFGPGVHTLVWVFDGLAIRSSGVDGPYTIDLVLYDSTARSSLDTASTVTEPLAHTAFDLPAARFAPATADTGTDLDGDGLFDELVIRFSVEVLEARNFRLHASLNDVLVEYTYAFLDVGIQQVPLTFDGMSIWRAALDGPYTVGASLYDSDAGDHTDSTVYVTSTYSFDQFERLPAAYTGAYEEFGLNEDADPEYEFLVVRAEVEVHVVGRYDVGMGLSSSGSEIQWCFGPLDLLETRYVTCRFTGPAIYASGLDGPYTIELLIWDYQTGYLLDQRFVFSRSYSFTDFDPTGV